MNLLSSFSLSLNPLSSISLSLSLNPFILSHPHSLWILLFSPTLTLWILLFSLILTLFWILFLYHFLSLNSFILSHTLSLSLSLSLNFFPFLHLNFIPLSLILHDILRSLSPNTFLSISSIFPLYFLFLSSSSTISVLSLPYLHLCFSFALAVRQFYPLDLNVCLMALKVSGDVLTW